MSDDSPDNWSNPHPPFFRKPRSGVPGAEVRQAGQKVENLDPGDDPALYTRLLLKRLQQSLVLLDDDWDWMSIQANECRDIIELIEKALAADIRLDDDIERDEAGQDHRRATGQRLLQEHKGCL